jgi:anaerobic selenocysteine-containing dehydrogenase
MMSAHILRERIGGPTIALHPEAAKSLGVEAGQLVNISFDGASGDVTVKLDDTISVGVVLVPRGMGLAIREPIPAQVRVPVEVK